MGPGVAEGLAAVFSTIALATAVLIGMKMRYDYLAKIRGGGPDREQLARLVETVGQLRDDVVVLRDQVVELGERVDFAERMLAKGNAPDIGAPLLPPRREPR